jgi:hypothetical protein
MSNRSEEPTPPSESPGNRSGRRVGLALAAAVIAIAVAILAVLAVQDTSQGSVAIRQTQGLVMTTLADTEKDIRDEGGALDVTWSSTPSPSGGGHLVVARLQVRPSGEVGQAEFVVANGRVSPRNDLARRLLSRSEG